MSLRQLDNLLRNGLKKEAPSDLDIDNLISSGERRLHAQWRVLDRQRLGKLRER
ncbi:MAG TPA: hypothetical protein VJ853_04070 [Thermoanaerobaculia bacterium]|nr:hypothetical protein [Thermoanaerobaculia bacterium]